MANATVEVLIGGPNAGHGLGDAVTVVLGDSHRIRREHIREALEQDGFVVVAEADSAIQAAADVLHHGPQICLLGIDVTGYSIRAIREIVAKRPGTRIAVLAESTAESKVMRAIREGADGVLLTQTPAEEISEAVRSLLRGEQPLPRALTMPSADKRPRRPRQPWHRVTWAIFYVPRFARHLRRRLRSDMPLHEAWASTRERMLEYR
jgi:DNA-binding NarL/FixJ family response regulator